MTEDSLLQISFPALDHKMVTAAFDGRRITSDGGVMLLGRPVAGLDYLASLLQSLPIEALRC
jgi:hypothetical protein